MTELGKVIKAKLKELYGIEDGDLYLTTRGEFLHTNGRPWTTYSDSKLYSIENFFFIPFPDPPCALDIKTMKILKYPDNVYSSGNKKAYMQFLKLSYDV